MATPNPPQRPLRSAQAVDQSDSFIEVAQPKPQSSSTLLPALRLPPLRKAGAPAVKEPPPLPTEPTPPPPPLSEPSPSRAPSSPFILEKWTQDSITFMPPAPDTKPPSAASVPSFSMNLPAPSKADPPPINMGRVGSYELRELIGEGGMGLVYKAEDVLLKRMVALKIMKPELARARTAWKLFLKEAQATAAIKNDRIATIYQVGEAGKSFYLAMELLKGETLETRLRRGRVSLKQALWIAREAALGLAIAHDAGLIHRDIKPANLWLEPNSGSSAQFGPLFQYHTPLTSDELEAHFGRLKILDFGLAQLAHESAGRRDVSGTPGYMAPEQAEGKTGDERTDIFSLGVVLFRMVTGKMPFKGETSLELLTAVATQPATLASEYNPTLPAELVRLIQKMLSHDPVARPNSAADVAIAVDRIQMQIDRPPVPEAPRRKRRSWPWIIGGTIAATVVFAAFWLMFNQRNDGDPVLGTAPANAAAGNVLSAREVVNHIGDEVTVEFTVHSIQRAEEVAYAYESEPTDDDQIQFRLAIPAPITSEMRRRGSNWPESLNGAVLRLNGQVTLNGKFAEILVSDIEQFQKIEEESKTASSKPNSNSDDALAHDGDAKVGPSRSTAAGSVEDSSKSAQGGAAKKTKVEKRSKTDLDDQ